MSGTRTDGPRAVNEQYAHQERLARSGPHEHEKQEVMA